MSGNRRQGGRSRRRSSSGRREWVGGRVSSPFYVVEGDSYRPEITLWLELPDNLIVGTSMQPPGQEVSLGETLVATLDSPMVGAPRRPDLIRVADAEQAAEVRLAVPDIELRIAPTPELAEVVRRMGEHLEGGATEGSPLSYREDGRIAAELVAKMFRAAETLYRLAPWETLDDDQVVRMDVPALGVRGACVTVIGALGESLGVVVFPSLEGYQGFVEGASRVRDNGALDLGTTLLALNFVPGRELPEELREEVARHGWPVADVNAYPWVEHRDRDGVPRPLSEQDMLLATACATSFATLFAAHRSIFAGEAGESVCESYSGGDGVEVRLTYPYERSHLFAVDDPPRREAASGARKVGRNERCPCGSGKKYKKCCLPSDAAETADEARPAAAHDLDRRVVQAMHRFAFRRFGDDWWFRAAEDFDDFEESFQLAAPWSLYCCAVEGKPIVDWYLQERRSLPADERAWLEAQRRAWLSAWEVVSVEPGRSIKLRDSLSWEEREVLEVSGSHTLSVHTALLGRVVDFEGVALLAGVHPCPLPPIPAAEVVRRLRGRLRRKRAVPVDRLRDEKFGRYAIKRWDEAVLELEMQYSVPPRLHNSGGDELLLTVDHFDLETRATSEVARLLATLPEVDPPNPDADEREFVFLRGGSSADRGGDSTVVGRAIIDGDRLRLETNSVARADGLRTSIEATCGDRIVHRIREHSDPTAMLANIAAAPSDVAPAEVPDADMSEMLRAVKAKHYADWVDQPLPALDGQTPREAVRTKAGKAQVEMLLKDCEYLEGRLPEAQRFDFSVIRRQLEV